MAKNIIRTILLFIISGAFSLVFGQTPDAAVKPTYYVGDVAAISQKSITITTKSGPSEVVLTDKTAYKRSSAENPKDLASATAGALTDISVGDKVIVSALLAKDGKSMNARSVYFMTKADIAAKNAKEAEDWRKRGIAGKVTSVNAQTGKISVDIRSLTSSTALVVTPKDKAKFIRYAPDSERFDEAKPSALAEIKAGDMLRAIGDKNADGTVFSAETILTGAFQTLAGTVKTIDAGKNEVVIKDLQTGKDVTILLADASVLKRFPPEMAERMASFQSGGGARPAGDGGMQARPVNPGGQAARADRGKGRADLAGTWRRVAVAV